MSRKKILINTFIICLSIILVLPAQNVYASKASRATKAYKKFLKQDSYTVNSVKYDMARSSFVVKDINNDKIKELILFPNTDAMCSFVIYSWRNGKVKYVMSAGHSELGYFKGKSVFITQWTSMGISTTYYYTYKKGKLKSFASFTDYEFFDPSMKNVYTFSDKKISKKKFYKKLKSKYKISKSKKYKYILGKECYDVTKSNIKKYVK